MTLNFENNSSEDLEKEIGENLEALALKVIEAALDEIGCPYEAEVNLSIEDSGEVHRLNRAFRNVDSTTDVLSFPMIEYEREGDFTTLGEEAESHEDDFNPETGELLLGDIVLNASRVISQAFEYGHSVKREYAFLITHSVLHLCGFDHMEEEEAQRMEEKQRQILKKLDIPR